MLVGRDVLSQLVGGERAGLSKAVFVGSAVGQGSSWVTLRRLQRSGCGHTDREGLIPPVDVVFLSIHRTVILNHSQ
ncbi:hypothetical protein GCM10025781_00050 [Kocuria gwangalliensis]|uniref:Uncharacterized protein n=1 Tax=Kocuria gwangalliensis TaxID=501592 RepID=A0ABP8WEM2_9MICC